MKCKYCAKTRGIFYTIDVCENCYIDLSEPTFGEKLIGALKEALDHARGLTRLRTTKREAQKKTKQD